MFLQHSGENYLWGIWKMDETLEELLSILPHREKYEESLKRFTASHRRLEWLAVRVLLYRLLGEERKICYYPSGKPFFEDHSGFISISHTRGYVAVILSKESEVGIDIEQYGHRVEKVAHKFMREDEKISSYLNEDVWGLLLHWSAKEVMFKCMNESEVDFRRHLKIEPFVVKERGAIQAKEFRTERKQAFLIHYLIHPDFVMTWQIG